MEIFEELIAAVEAGVTRSESTRTGIQPFDAALKEISAVSVEQVIPVVEQHEADARASGVAPRWYRVRFNDQGVAGQSSSQNWPLSKM